jgi:hypothetical protein
MHAAADQAALEKDITALSESISAVEDGKVCAGQVGSRYDSIQMFRISSHVMQFYFLIV